MVVIITNNLLKRLGGDSALAVFAIVGRLYTAVGTPQTGIVQGMQDWGAQASRLQAGPGQARPDAHCLGFR